jgi:acyl dehydratase
MIGDLTTCRGTVVSKDESAGSVKLEIEAVDQRGDSTASGWAVVSLPRKAA